VIAGTAVSGGDATAFLAEDRLHASADGVTALAGVSLDALVACGKASRGTLAPNVAIARSRCEPRATSLPADDEKNLDERQVDVITRLIDTRTRLRAGDATAVDRGIELIEQVPSGIGSPCEVELVRDLAAMSPDARASLQRYLSTCALRAASADALPIDHSRWVLVAAGLGDAAAMRAASVAYRDALARGEPRTRTERRLADAAYDALDGGDDRAAADFWPDPAATVKRWQREAGDMAATMRAAGITASAPAGSAKERIVKRRSPEARGARLVVYLRAAGRPEDASRVEALVAPP
jgi:hypothetical protein